MPPPYRSLSLLFLAALVVLPARADPQAAPTGPAAVLGRFVGDWETQTWIHNEGPPQRESQTKGRAVCQETLGGRYLEFRTRSIPAGEADLQIMTYDAKAGLYRQWLFDADGYRHEAEGHFDPTTSILKWEGRTAGAAFIIEDHWVGADRLEWTLKRTSVDGRLLQTIKGVLTRLKVQ